MTETPAPAPKPLPSKARVIFAAFADFAVDLFLPTAIFVLLAPTRLSAVVRLTIGGFFVTAKAIAGRVPATGGPEGHGTFGHALAAGVLIAVVCTGVTVSIALTKGSDALAIGLGTGVLVVIQGVNLIRTWRRLDSFALLVLVELVATIVLTSVSHDPRLWAARPFMMQVSKPMAAGGDPVRAEAFERAGRESPRFRRTEQAMTLGLAMVLLAEAVLRVATVLSHPASDVLASSLWSQIPAVGLLVVYVAVVRLVFVPRASREVDALMPTKRADGEGAASSQNG
jgi:hypothetical protein